MAAASTLCTCSQFLQKKKARWFLRGSFPSPWRHGLCLLYLECSLNANQLSAPAKTQLYHKCWFSSLKKSIWKIYESDFQVSELEKFLALSFPFISHRSKRAQQNCMGGYRSLVIFVFTVIFESIVMIGSDLGYRGIKRRLSSKCKYNNSTKRFGISEKNSSELLVPSAQSRAMSRAESEVFGDGKSTYCSPSYAQEASV